MKQIKFENQNITPSKIVCVGRNYVEHIKELNNEIPENMVLFNKPNSAISDKFYFITPHTRFEAEICFIIQNNQLSGIGVGFDLTKKDIQEYLKQKGLPWERAKAFNNSAIFSEFMKLDNNIETIEMKLYQNKQLQQHATYELMIYKPHQILEEILSFMELNDGDIIMTGTPKGVNFYQKNDIFKIELFQNNTLILQKTWKVI